MNITPKIETVALRELVPLSLRLCFLAFLLGAVSLCFAKPPGPPPDTQTQLQTSATELAEDEPAMTIPPEELEALVAPIALYPDPLLIQVLAASTYPLEIVQLKQWMDENKKLKGEALLEAVVQQNWDPSVQALAAFTTVVNKLANKIQWTTDLGNAFLGQQSDVMDAVQRLRAKAEANGALKTNDKQKVANETTHGEQTITIEPAQQDVVYVPTYNTQAVYGDSDSSNYSGDSGYSNASGYSGYSNSSSGYSDDGYWYVGYALAAAGGYAWGYYNWRDRSAEVNYDNYYKKNYSRTGTRQTGTIKLTTRAITLITGTAVRPIALRGSRLKGKVHGNTIRPIAETPLMAIAISRTGSDRVTIVFPGARVIGHPSQQQHVLAINSLKVMASHNQPAQMPATNWLEITCPARPAVPVRARDRRTLALRTAWGIACRRIGPEPRRAEPSGRPMEISPALSAAAALKVWRPPEWVRRRVYVRAVRRWLAVSVEAPRWAAASAAVPRWAAASVAARRSVVACLAVERLRHHRHQAHD